MHNDILPGGKADDMDPSDFDPEALAKGTAVEMEHTDDPDIAEEVATDHNSEHESVDGYGYYDLLSIIEDALSAIDEAMTRGDIQAICDITKGLDNAKKAIREAREGISQTEDGSDRQYDGTSDLGMSVQVRKDCERIRKLPENRKHEVMRVLESGEDIRKSKKVGLYEKGSLSRVSSMAIDERKMPERELQRISQLRRSRDQGLQEMARIIRQFLPGHGENADRIHLGQIPGQQRKLRTGELQMGDSTAAERKQEKYSPSDVRRRNEDVDELAERTTSRSSNTYSKVQARRDNIAASDSENNKSEAAYARQRQHECTSTEQPSRTESFNSRMGEDSQYGRTNSSEEIADNDTDGSDHEASWMDEEENEIDSKDEDYYDKLAEMEAGALDEINDQESDRYEDPIKYGATFNDHEPFSLKPTTNTPKPMEITPTGGKQQSLFPKAGSPGQLNLFADTGVPDELLPKHLREPKPPEPPKPPKQKQLFRKSWSETKENGNRVAYTLYAEVLDDDLE